MANEERKGKQPYISGEDRPQVQVDPDKLVGELRVRDLESILGGSAILKQLRDKHWKLEKLEKFETIEKHPKLEKLEKLEKIEKFEKPEKFEKLEKIETDPVQKFRDPIDIPDPLVIQQVLDLVRGLTDRVDKLANQVGELQKR